MNKLNFPPLNLSEWKETKESLHKYCRLVGAIREVLSDPQPNSLHTNLLLCRRGFTTSPLPRGDGSSGQTFEVIIEMNRARLSIESNYREPLHITLTGQSLNALCDETCSLLIDIGVKPPLERPSFLEGTRGQFDKDLVKKYWQSLKSTKRLLKQIKAQLPGDSSPVQMHVDTLILSLTWYCNEFFSDSAIEEIDFGLSVGDDLFPETHFFIQSFPDRQALKNVLAYRDTDLVIKDSSKMILPYSKVVETARAEKILLDFYNSVFIRF